MYTDFWAYVNDATMKGIMTSSCCQHINIPKCHQGQSLFKRLCDLSSLTVAELAKPDEEVLLERNYLERAAAIDEYCFYSDLLDQSQSGKLFHLHTYAYPCLSLFTMTVLCISLLSYSNAVQAVEETYHWTVDWRLPAALCHQHRDVFRHWNEDTGGSLAQSALRHGGFLFSSGKVQIRSHSCTCCVCSCSCQGTWQTLLSCV